ncbi:MAG: flagellar protein FlaG [Treponema sp.]|nr:flagellar protein FlaG [Treponema sp.]MDD7768475.1 flagellar protein FlaG [Treponema sp.]MDY3132195.1 flagellar protein FlaG [Treponema sp.]
MNTINTSSSVTMAMDGQQQLYTSGINFEKSAVQSQIISKTTPNGAQVAQNIEQNLAQIKADTQQLEKLSEIINGRKLQFNVNKDLGAVVIKVVDSNTNQVLKEIPSEDIQKLKLRIRQTIGSLFDQMA